jgi:hypothetical protein
VEPGIIFKRKVGTKMEDRSEELAESLEFVELLSYDEDGKVVSIKIY